MQVDSQHRWGWVKATQVRLLSLSSKQVNKLQLILTRPPRVTVRRTCWANQRRGEPSLLHQVRTKHTCTWVLQLPPSRHGQQAAHHGGEQVNDGVTGWMSRIRRSDFSSLKISHRSWTFWDCKEVGGRGRGVVLSLCPDGSCSSFTGSSLLIFRESVMWGGGYIFEDNWSLR